jgi:hypothetical protein
LGFYRFHKEAEGVPNNVQSQRFLVAVLVPKKRHYLHENKTITPGYLNVPPPAWQRMAGGDTLILRSILII